MPGSSSVAVGSTWLIVAAGSSEQVGSGVLGTLGSGEVDLTGGGAETGRAEMGGAETGGAGMELVTASPSPR